jgi:hypothetical protein
MWAQSACLLSRAVRWGATWCYIEPWDLSSFYHRLLHFLSPPAFVCVHELCAFVKDCDSSSVLVLWMSGLISVIVSYFCLCHCCSQSLHGTLSLLLLLLLLLSLTSNVVAWEEDEDLLVTTSGEPSTCCQLYDWFAACSKICLLMLVAVHWFSQLIVIVGIILEVQESILQWSR